MHGLSLSAEALRALLWAIVAPLFPVAPSLGRCRMFLLASCVQQLRPSPSPRHVRQAAAPLPLVRHRVHDGASDASGGRCRKRHRWNRRSRSAQPQQPLIAEASEQRRAMRTDERASGRSLDAICVRTAAHRVEPSIGWSEQARASSERRGAVTSSRVLRHCHRRLDSRRFASHATS